MMECWWEQSLRSAPTKLGTTKIETNVWNGSKRSLQQLGLGSYYYYNIVKQSGRWRMVTWFFSLNLKKLARFGGGRVRFVRLASCGPPGWGPGLRHRTNVWSSTPRCHGPHIAGRPRPKLMWPTTTHPHPHIRALADAVRAAANPSAPRRVERRLERQQFSTHARALTCELRFDQGPVLSGLSRFMVKSIS